MNQKFIYQWLLINVFSGNVKRTPSATNMCHELDFWHNPKSPFILITKIARTKHLNHIPFQNIHIPHQCLRNQNACASNFKIPKCPHNAFPHPYYNISIEILITYICKQSSTVSNNQYSLVKNQYVHCQMFVIHMISQFMTNWHSLKDNTLWTSLV
jgi:hypothetical protein